MNNIFATEGNVGSSYELKSVPGKDDKKYKVLNFTLRASVQTLVDGKYKDTGGFWVNVEYWGALAEMTYKLMKKGVRLYVMGEISEGSFTATRGENVGEQVIVKTIKADTVLFSPLGIETIVYTAKRGNDEQQAQNDSMNEQASVEA